MVSPGYCSRTGDQEICWPLHLFGLGEADLAPADHLEAGPLLAFWEEPQRGDCTVVAASRGHRCPSARWGEQTPALGHLIGGGTQIETTRIFVAVDLDERLV